jgi:hypothetical protein
MSTSISSHTAPIETDASFPEPFVVRLSKSPVNKPPFRFSNRAATERDALFQSLLYISAASPVKKPYFYVPLIELACSDTLQNIS